VKRRSFIIKVGCFTAAASQLSCRAIRGREPSPKERPNIILIVADDLGYRELGCYGQEKIETPHIDSLSAEGIRFTQHYAGAPVCAPARCTIMTGKHGGHAPIRDNLEIRKSIWNDRFGGQYPLPLGVATVAELLQKAGYATGAFGKWGLGGVGTTGDPVRRGFDHFFGYNCQRHAHNYYPRYLVSDDRRVFLEGNTRSITGRTYAPQLIADAALSFIRNNKEGPFFLYYATIIPHLPLQVPDDFLARYKGRWPETPYNGRSYLPNPTPRATYAAMITFMDFQVGRILSLLDELRIAEQTLVLFTSDNGTTYLKGQVDYEFFKSVGNLRGLKGSVYEGGIRVPLIARWKGKVQPGRTSTLLCAHYDLLATILDAAGLPIPPDTDGISYLPTLLGSKTQTEHDYLFWDFAGYGGQLAVRMGKWKGVKRNLIKNPKSPLELYNLEEDESETRNVAKEYPEVTKKIEKIMLEARSKPAEPKFRFGIYPS